MWLYAIGAALTAVGYAYAAGKKRGEEASTKGVDQAMAEAFLIALLWVPALFFFWPYVAGKQRGASLKDARVRSALREMEYAKLEEDSRHEVALALVKGGDRK